MHNTTVTDGDSPWNLRHGNGQFAGPRIPFGSTVDFLAKPETVKALPKFEPRSSVGMLVGYHLQPGAEWKNEFLVFPREMFVDFGFELPRRNHDLKPVRTQELRLTDKVPQFMMKESYDIARRTLSPPTFIQDVPDDEDNSAVDDIAENAAVDPAEDKQNVFDTQEEAYGQERSADKIGDTSSEQTCPVSPVRSSLCPGTLSDLSRDPRFHE